MGGSDGFGPRFELELPGMTMDKPFGILVGAMGGGADGFGNLGKLVIW
jgi:hypothetical protein